MNSTTKSKMTQAIAAHPVTIQVAGLSHPQCRWRTSHHPTPAAVVKIVTPTMADTCHQPDVSSTTITTDAHINR